MFASVGWAVFPMGGWHLRCSCGIGSGDLAGRLAVVPMAQEAKGLDAGPRLAAKLVGCGDNRSAAIVSRIAAEEKAHVAVGEAACCCLDLHATGRYRYRWDHQFHIGFSCGDTSTLM